MSEHEATSYFPVRKSDISIRHLVLRVVNKNK
jgi:hypothetical protein